MKNLMIILTLFLVACGNKSNPSIILIGDSTVASQPLERGAQGWGHHLQSPNVKNMARSGRSSKSFYHEAWTDVLKEKPDYILIQFGLNDSKNDDRFTDPSTSFKDYLRSYVGDAKSRGIRVIFVTSPSRLLSNDVYPYVIAMEEVALELNIKTIDLYSFSIQLQNKYQDNIYEIYHDYTHPNEKGSLIYSDFIRNELTILGVI